MFLPLIPIVFVASWAASTYVLVWYHRLSEEEMLKANNQFFVLALKLFGKAPFELEELEAKDIIEQLKDDK